MFEDANNVQVETMLGVRTDSNGVEVPTARMSIQVGYDMWYLSTPEKILAFIGWVTQVGNLEKLEKFGQEVHLHTTERKDV